MSYDVFAMFLGIFKLENKFVVMYAMPTMHAGFCEAIPRGIHALPCQASAKIPCQIRGDLRETLLIAAQQPYAIKLDGMILTTRLSSKSSNSFPNLLHI